MVNPRSRRKKAITTLEEYEGMLAGVKDPNDLETEEFIVTVSGLRPPGADPSRPPSRRDLQWMLQHGGRVTSTRRTPAKKTGKSR
jgi:hypothetical protein